MSDTDLPDDTEVVRSTVSQSEVPSTSSFTYSKPVPQAQRRSLRLLQKKAKVIKKPVDMGRESQNEVTAGDSPGLYGMIKGAFNEMTTQLVSAIQTAFKGSTAVQKSPRERSKTPLSNPIYKRQMSRTRVRSKSHANLHDSDDSSSDSESDFHDTISIDTSCIVQPQSRANFSRTVKLPAYTGKEKWEVWFNRFQAVARLNDWDKRERINELLPRLHGDAGEFAFDQLPTKTLDNYKKLIKELGNRFGTIETSRTYRLQFSRRRQLIGETPEKFVSELKRLTDTGTMKQDRKTCSKDFFWVYMTIKPVFISN